LSGQFTLDMGLFGLSCLFLCLLTFHCKSRERYREL